MEHLVTTGKNIEISMEHQVTTGKNRNSHGTSGHSWNKIKIPMAHLVTAEIK